MQCGSSDNDDCIETASHLNSELSNKPFVNQITLIENSTEPSSPVTAEDILVKIKLLKNKSTCYKKDVSQFFEKSLVCNLYNNQFSNRKRLS